MRRLRLLLWLPFLAFSLALQTAPAPQQPMDAPMTIVEFQHGEGQPNMNFLVPVVLTPGPGVKVGRLELTVTYSRAQLRFVSADTSGLISGINADVETQEMDDPQDPTQRILSITISTIDGQGGRQTIQEGRLLFLTFQFDKELKPETTVTLKVDGKAVTVDNPPAAVQPFVVRSAALHVVETVISSCFFYMH